MRTYFVKCLLSNGNVIHCTSKHRTENVKEYADFITNARFHSFISDDESRVDILNMRHVVTMEITFKEET